MPQMGFDMQEGTVVRWLKTEGSQVVLGEPIAEIETDKAVVEFESYASGVLQSILVLEGATVPVGEPIAIITAEGEAPAETATPRPERPPEAAAPAIAVPTAPPPQRDAPARAADEARASPVARRLAQERGVDLTQIVGTGPGGRITREDVLRFESAPAPAAVTAPVSDQSVTPAITDPASSADSAAGERIPLSRMRQQIARVTVASKQAKPHFYVTSDIDMSSAMEMRLQLNQAVDEGGVRITVNDVIVKACAEALKTHPKMNAFFHEDGLEMHDRINIGVAIAEEEGLIVPAVMDCGNKSLLQIATAVRDLAERAKSGALRPEEYSGGTFAVSNLGMFDVTSFVAIIYPPQTAVLAVGTVTKSAVVRDDELGIAQMMTATLSCDHRVVDGAEGARFIVEVKRHLEDPLGLVM